MMDTSWDVIQHEPEEDGSEQVNTAMVAANAAQHAARLVEQRVEEGKQIAERVEKGIQAIGGYLEEAAAMLDAIRHEGAELNELRECIIGEMQKIADGGVSEMRKIAEAAAPHRAASDDLGKVLRQMTAAFERFADKMEARKRIVRDGQGQIIGIETVRGKE
jgi:methyl-accepting chemotaxis protein